MMKNLLRKRSVYLLLVSSAFIASGCITQPSNGGTACSPVTCDSPPVRTPEESILTYDTRKNQVLDYFSSLTIGPFRENIARSFSAPALARAYRGIDLDQIESQILDPAAVAFAIPGTRFDSLDALCRRLGDYDFSLVPLVRLAYLLKNHPFSETASSKLLHSLINVSGNRQATTFNIGVCGTHAETENHILQTESSRYLANQLLMAEAKKKGTSIDAKIYDNSKNGFDAWFIAWLRQRLTHDFNEYNSKPYEGLTYSALLNLYDFSENIEIKTLTQSVLDYLAAKHAVQSNLLRKIAPFRRQPQYAMMDDFLAGDKSLGIYWYYLGNLEEAGFEAAASMKYVEDYFYSFTATSEYRLPRTVIDLSFNRPDGKSYLETFSHDAIEIYDVHPHAVISAGGIYLNDSSDMGLAIMDGWAYPTTILYAGNQSSYLDLIRIEGARAPVYKKNACVTRNFACGLTPVIPTSIPEHCIRRSGRFSFIDLNSAECPHEAHLYVAMYSQPCDAAECFAEANTWGFWETYDPLPDDSIENFATQVLKKNPKQNYIFKTENRYFTVDNQIIDFKPWDFSFFKNPIRAINNLPEPDSIHDYPLARGDLIQADRLGHMLIQCPWTNRKISIDVTNPNHAVRVESP